jgi:hypothetical protein
LRSSAIKAALSAIVGIGLFIPPIRESFSRRANL